MGQLRDVKRMTMPNGRMLSVGDIVVFDGMTLNIGVITRIWLDGSWYKAEIGHILDGEGQIRVRNLTFDLKEHTLVKPWWGKELQKLLKAAGRYPYNKEELLWQS